MIAALRLRRRFVFAGALLSGLAMAACQPGAMTVPENSQAFLQLGKEPLAAAPWSFADHAGHVIKTDHFQIYTTVDDSIYLHLMTRVLEATHDRVMLLNPQFRRSAPLDCYVFASRGQWETYTRARAGSNAPIYLQISSGGYCQEGVFAGYDIGREQTLSVIAHEAWHQYSWFAFKDRLPAWLEEGLATQNEAIEWNGTHPTFNPMRNTRRFVALRQAVRTNHLWSLPELLATHAGRVIKLPQASIDAYYAQLWSLVLFLEQSPTYQPKLQSLLADATSGKLTQALAGSGVSQREIDNFTERWNTTAGPLYTQKYFNPDLVGLEREYLAWLKQFTQTWPQN